MEYTELADYAIYAGAVTLWSATADESRALPDPRALSPQHEAHVAAHRPGQDPGWIGTVFEISRDYDAAALERTLVAWHARHETFRTTVRLTPRGLERLLFQVDDIVVSRRAAGTYDTVERVYDVVSRYFDRTVNPSTWPHLVAATVVPTDQLRGPRFLLAFAADHSVMDAYSQVIAVSELDQLYAAALAGVDLSNDPPVASYVDFSAAERGIAALADHGHATTGRWRAFLADQEPKFPAFPLPTGDSTSAAVLPQCSVSRSLVSADAAAAIHQAARDAGFGMQPAIVVALAEALRRVADGAPLKFVMPMHTRTAQYQSAMGWFVGISPVEVDLAGAGEFADQLALAEVATRFVQQDAQIPFTTIAELLDIRSAPRFVISFVDIRHLPGAAQFDAQRARALRSIRYSDDEVYLWIIRAQNGINVSSRYPNNPEAAQSFEAFLAAFAHVLGEFSTLRTTVAG